MITNNQIRVNLQNGVPIPSSSPPANEVEQDASNSFIDPTALISGMVALGKKNYVGPFVRIEAKMGFLVKLSGEDNLQDNVLVSAITRNSEIGERTSIAHGARVINSTIGNFVFIGFNATIENAIIEDGAMVLHGARVVGVTIPVDRIVPPGAVIIDEVQTQSLTHVEEANIEFKEDVVSVNIELASGYGQIALGLNGVSANPKTSWIAESEIPILGKDVSISKGLRIIGSVHLGAGASVGKMTSIRGDEGVPISIGEGAWIGNRVTFHALKGQSITIGDQLTTGDGAVFHGGLTLGNQVTVGDNAVLFKSFIGSECSIGNNAIVIGVTLSEKSIVPNGALVLKQEDADRCVPL